MRKEMLLLKKSDTLTSILLIITTASCWAQYGGDSVPILAGSSSSASAGTHIGIKNPHSHFGNISPTLPPSSISYYPPPEIPHPDFAILLKEKEQTKRL